MHVQSLRESPMAAGKETHWWKQTPVQIVKSINSGVILRMENLNAIVKCMKWTLTQQSRRSSFWALTAAWQLFSLLFMCCFTVFDCTAKRCGEIPLKNVHKSLFTSLQFDVQRVLVAAVWNDCSPTWQGQEWNDLKWTSVEENELLHEETLST